MQNRLHYYFQALSFALTPSCSTIQYSPEINVVFFLMMFAVTRSVVVKHAYMYFPRKVYLTILRQAFDVKVHALHWSHLNGSISTLLNVAFKDRQTT